MLPRLRLSLFAFLALTTIPSLAGCAATEEENDDSEEVEGATRVTRDWIAAGRDQVLTRSPGQKLYAKLAIGPGRDWEIVESAPWLSALPKPTAKFEDQGDKRFRVFDWDSRKLPGGTLYGVTFRQIDAATKEPVLDDSRAFIMADAIIVFGGAEKIITVTSAMPAQTIPVPSGWVLEMKLPKSESGYGWKLQMKEDGPLIDPATANLQFAGFEPDEKNHSKAPSFRVRTATSDLRTPTSFRFVSAPLPPLSSNAPLGRHLEYQATVYSANEVRR